MDNMNSLIPSKGDTVVQIPITLEKQGSMKEQKSGRVLLFLIVTATYGFLMALFIVLGKGVFFKCLVITLMYITILRIFVVEEFKFRKVVKELESSDYEFEAKTISSIYKISDRKPYICYFKNGEIGLVVRLEYDCLVGDYDTITYNGYQAITEALSRIAESKLKVDHIDCTSNSVLDNRINVLIDDFKSVEYDSLKEVYLNIFEYMRECADAIPPSVEYYIFRYSGNEREFINEVNEVLNLLMLGFYSSYTIMNSETMPQPIKELFNLESFSMGESYKSIKNSETLVNKVRPIYIIKNGEKVILNKTTAEKNMESKIAKDEVELQRKARKQKVENFDIDI